MNISIRYSYMYNRIKETLQVSSVQTAQAAIVVIEAQSPNLSPSFVLYNHLPRSSAWCRVEALSSNQSRN